MSKTVLPRGSRIIASHLPGEFRGGRIWGKGLLTFNEDKVGAEGYFQDSRFSRDGDASHAVSKARQVASFARRLCSEACYDAEGGWRTEEEEQKIAMADNA